MTDIRKCDEFGWSKQSAVAYTFTLMGLTYFFPLFLMSILYGRMFVFLWHRRIPGIENMPEITRKRAMKRCTKKKRWVRLFIMVVFCFMICHMPMNVMSFLWYASRLDLIVWSPPPYMVIIAFHAELLLYLNSALNPMLYALFHQTLKRTLIDCYKWVCCQGERPFWRSRTATMQHTVTLRLQRFSKLSSKSSTSSKSARSNRSVNL